MFEIDMLISSNARWRSFKKTSTQNNMAPSKIINFQKISKYQNNQMKGFKISINILQSLEIEPWAYIHLPNISSLVEKYQMHCSKESY